MAQTIVRGPYLQNVTPNSITVRWRTNQPTDSRVRFGAEYARQTTTAELTTEHIVTLSGLQPATRYPYVVGTSGRDLSPAEAAFSFQTAPAAGSTAPVRLWVLGDFGTGSVRQQQAYDSFKQATQARRPDLWVWLGDNAYSFGRDDEFQRWVFDYYPDHLRNLPFVATPGNHDYHDDVNDFNIPYYALTTHPKQGEAGGVPSNSASYYSLDYGPVHLISLDSFGNEAGRHRIWDTTGTQIQWLKRDLAANTKPWTIIFFHHPPYTQGSRNSDTERDLILNRERLTPIFERYNVDLVLSGHSHIYERTYPICGHRGLSATFNKRTMATDTSTGRYDGSPNSCPLLPRKGSLTYIVNGSGGANAGRAPNYPHRAMVHSYTDEGGSMLIDVAENRLDAQWVSPGGVQDRFTMMKGVNRLQSFYVEYADTLTLTASWAGAAVAGNGDPARYGWSNGSTGRTLRTVNQSGTFRVTDGRGCLADEYVVNVAPKPTLSLTLQNVGKPTSNTYCPGGELIIWTALNGTAKNLTRLDWQLSDANGQFTNPVKQGTFSLLSAYGFPLPNPLPAGTNYRIRLFSRALPYIDPVTSEAFTVLAPASATVVGSSTALTGQPASVTVTLTGTPPWSGSFSDGTSFSASSSPVVVTFPSPRPGVIHLASITNACGRGTVAANAALTVLLPTATEQISPDVALIYPNPSAGDCWLRFGNEQTNPVQVVVRSVADRAVQSRHLTGVTAGQRLPLTLPEPGLYVVQLYIGAHVFTYKVVRQ